MNNVEIVRCPNCGKPVAVVKNGQYEWTICSGRHGQGNPKPDEVVTCKECSAK